MSAIYTTGRWRPDPGKEETFVEAWTAFAAWASRMPGAGALRLARDVRSPDVFVSFGEWQDMRAVRAWKGGAEFKERLAQVLQYVEDFEPTELELVATAEAGALAPEPVPAQ
jgi:heme-degrading monooxygenase HmoA